MSESTLISYGQRGVNSALNPFLLSADQVHKATNCRLSKQMWRTRYGVREMKLVGNDAALAEYQVGNTQGAIYYNPARGQGALVFGDDLGQIAESSAGKMFTLRLFGSDALEVRDISGGLQSPRHLHLAWLCQAENYLFRSDDVGMTWAYNGEQAEFSPGYVEDGSCDREASRIPNKIGAMIYAFGRMHVVRNGRDILVGDGLHSQNLTSSLNVTFFTEQTYWATGRHFSPPSQMGAILAGGILPQQDTTHGHSELLWHAKNDGVFSLNTNVYPREAWAEQALTRHVLLSAAATGPYAMALSESDQFFRSHKGIQSIRSARAERSVIGSPYSNLAAEVKEFMRGDTQEDLRFCSLVRWQKQDRILCTVYPMVDGRFRWHRGFVVSNLLPGEGRADVPPAWEGLWTLPCALGGVTQFVSGCFDGMERLFAICWNPTEGRKKLAEITETLESDRFANGSESRISCQLITKQLAPAGIFQTVEFAEAFLYVERVTTDLDWEVSYRLNGKREWRSWGRGFIPSPATENDDWAQREEIPDGLHSLGTIPEGMAKGRSIQFRIRWRGAASVQFMVRHGAGKAVQTGESNGVSVFSTPHSDYEYNDCGNRWEENPSSLCPST